ncbi:hypothetical protein FD30_GL000752 [Levilactobacillus namurensis DSM 19117]|uniref:Uncharacterized protein n=2 Tax=Levilactobacillus namurensis TaxID=380393 RepID=A0A0R1K0Q8_9LACO|nr:hypothetical protein [Levilactobacillus namurensis]PTM24278.1 hypothetical protein DA798_01465 [Lactobacillus sp. PFC-70]KRK76973.1 hypothetical protein FD30_GL000752 [Levilactobacillus namurensis DSM 19117]MCW3777427.1 hypothetical protein [Levilactobacillus namurensis]MDT7014560.1 hypothetical protein [Levilactobacillus namurensis]MDT7018505.1 hypothetical protein [Levilactobacillus namurensis]
MKEEKAFTETDWQRAQAAVYNEYDRLIKRLHVEGVDYTILQARRIVIYQDLVQEWKHNLPTLMTDLTDNAMAETVFEDLATDGQSHVLDRCAKKMEKWPDYIPSPLTIWLELAEDADREG